MKKMFNKVREKFTRLAINTKTAISNAKAETYIDTGVKILIAVVIGALLLTLLYAVFNETVFPTLTQKIQGMFNYTGGGN